MGEQEIELTNKGNAGFTSAGATTQSGRTAAQPFTVLCRPGRIFPG